MVFNRPELTLKVFEEIRKVKPAKLYIAADGARSVREGEKEKCIKTREVIKHIDWECDVKTLFRDENLGCKMAVCSAINWFFEMEEEGIILEDDSLPNQSFFFFCEELLIKYRNTDKIMQIGGNNFQPGMESEFSYYFSRYCNMPGWATWRRAWAKYDVAIKELPDFIKENRIEKIFGSNSSRYYWLYQFWQVYKNKIDTWDYQWAFTVWNNDGLCISPTKNFISNIGYNADATHTTSGNERLAELKTEQISRIIHPKIIQRDFRADKKAEKVQYNITYVKKIISWGFINCVKLNLIK